MSPRAQEPKSPGEKAGRATSSRARALPRSRALSDKAPSFGEATCVILYLKDPREQSWGVLLKTAQAGLWIRSIPLDAFEDWAREVAAGGEGVLGPSTFFVPYLRVEKIVLDEPWGPVPSLAERFERIAGRPAGAFLASGSQPFTES